MHPNEIPSKEPSKDKHINCAKRYASEANPGEPGKSFEDRMMQLYAPCGAQREEPSKKADEINHFSA